MKPCTSAPCSHASATTSPGRSARSVGRTAAPVYVRAAHLERRSQRAFARSESGDARVRPGRAVRRRRRPVTADGGHVSPLSWASLGRSDRDTPNERVTTLLAFVADVNAGSVRGHAARDEAHRSLAAGDRRLHGERSNVQPAGGRLRSRELSRAVTDQPVRAFPDRASLRARARCWPADTPAGVGAASCVRL